VLPDQRPETGDQGPGTTNQNPLPAVTAADAAEVTRPIRLGYRLEYAIFRVAFALFAALPRHMALRVGAWLGELFYLVDARDRRVAMLNLSIAFPEKSVDERRRILRASCRNLGRVAAEFCHLPRLDVENVPGIVSFADRAAWEHVIAAATERGAVILTAHFGNWELLAYVHGLLGHPITLVHRPMHNTLFDDAITAIRTKAGTRAIKKKAAAKEAIRALRRHDILVIPSDQNQTYDAGVFVDFFGKPACTTPGAARLAMLTGAPVFPAFLVREGESGRHRVVTLPEVEMIRSDDRNADVIANTQRCSLVVEDMIRRYPEQWIWFHKRWKTRPKGEPRLYPK
jgi:KDO2-lipid IV(A) lauroyltransferase